MSEILFLCVRNAGRSQMAKALFNKMARERGLTLRAESAGTKPADQVHDNVAAVMRDLGLEISQIAPKSVTNTMVESAFRVITMGCAVDSEACPALVISDVDDWPLPDPAYRSLGEVSRIRDSIAARISSLITELEAEVLAK